MGPKKLYTKEADANQNDQTGTVILNHVSAGGPPNYPNYKKSIIVYMERVYGLGGTFIRKGAHYEPPTVRIPSPGEFSDANDPTGILKHMFKKEHEKRAQEVAKLKEDWVKMSADLWGTMSASSKAAVKGYAPPPTDGTIITTSYPRLIISYEEYEKDLNPLILWKLIERTHMGSQTGSKVADQVSAFKRYAALVQSPEETTDSYKQRHDDALVILDSAGVPLPTDILRAGLYIDGLDNRRYAGLKSSLTNDEAKGLSTRPPTLLDAHALALRTTSVVMKQSGANAEAPANVFVTNAAHVYRGRGRGQGRGGGRDGGRGRGGGRTGDPRADKPKREDGCILCGSQDHWGTKCPDLQKAQSAVGKVKPVVTVAMLGDMHPDWVVFCLRDRSGLEYKTPPERVMVARKDMTNDSVILDSGANTHLFRSASLLTNLRQARYPISISGVGADVKVTQSGEFGEFGEVYLSPETCVNVLSLSLVMKQFPTELIPDRNGGKFLVHLPSGTVPFETKNGLYVLSRPLHTVMVQTVEEREGMFEKRKVRDAQTARELLRKLAFPGPAVVRKMIDAPHIMNCPVTSADLQRSTYIYGPDIPSLKGKTKLRASVPVKIEHVPAPAQRDQVLHTDIMFVNGEPSLITVSQPLGLVTSRFLRARTAGVLAEAITGVVNAHSVRGFRPTTLLSDGEGGIAKISSMLNALGVVFNPAGPGQHVPVVENMIRQIKERMRAVIADVPFRVSPLLLRWLVAFCVSCINMTPSTTRVDNTSSRELFLGRKVDYKRDLALSFGDYVQVHQENIIRNSMTPRTEGAIAMASVGNLQGSWKFYCISTGSIISRDHWTPLPMPRNVIDHLNALADLDKKGRGAHDLVLSRGTTIIELQDYEDVPVPYEPPATVGALPPAVTDPLQEPVPMPVQEEPEIAISIPGSSSAQERAPLEHLPQVEQVNADPPVGGEVDHPTIGVDHPTIGVDHPTTEDEVAESSPVIDDAQEQPVVPETPPRRYPLRANRTNFRDYHKYVANITLKKGIKTFGSQAQDAMISELRQILGLETWAPEDPSELTGAEIRATIFSSMFFKEKFTPQGVFDKLKARLVANGSQQDRTLYDVSSISSPTVSLKSVFLGAGIAAAEKRFTYTVDLIAAYLKISREGKEVGKKIVRVRIAKPIVDQLCVIDPDYQKYRLKDGSVIVRLKKAMYGCIESGRLLFDDVCVTLIGMGFVQNPHDPCVFNKGPLDQQCTAHVYVDDIFISCRVKEIAEQVLVDLAGVYGELKINRGNRHSYLGMTMDFAKEGECKITMSGYVDELLRLYSVTGSVATPATPTLQEIDPDSKPLSRNDRGEFHTAVAKLLFLAKRARPDILLAVAFLTTRVTVSTVEDQAKLSRVLKYLNGTKELGVILSFDKGMLQSSYVDVAFGVHADGKSHTGSIETMGKGAYNAKSTKQTLVTKSSTEGELVGASDHVSEMVHTRDYLLAQGYKMGPATLFQDNMSTIAMIKNGRPSSERTRHINIRYFFIKDRADAGEIQVTYKPTKEMIADILTKPLQGSLFRHLRALLLNWPETD